MKPKRSSSREWGPEPWDSHGQSGQCERQIQPRKWALVLVVLFSISLLVAACSVIGGALLLPTVLDASAVARRETVVGQMKEIGEAMSAYHRVHGVYPASFTKTRDGQVGCSWRVVIARHLSGADGSDIPDSSKTWDSQENLKLGRNVPDVFVSPFVSAPLTTTETHIFAVMHPESAISHPDCRKKPERAGNAAIGRLPRQVLAVYLPNHTAHWAAPVDMTLKRLQDELANTAPDSPVVLLFTDGSTVTIEKPLMPSVVQKSLVDLVSSADKSIDVRW